jgi:hypothetical protein
MRREVKDPPGPGSSHELPDSVGVEEIELNNLEVLADFLETPRRAAGPNQRGDVIPIGKESLHEVRADEATSTRDHDAGPAGGTHQGRSPFSPECSERGPRLTPGPQLGEATCSRVLHVLLGARAD